MFSFAVLTGSCASASGTGQGEELPRRELPPPTFKLAPSPHLGGGEVCFNALDDNRNRLIDEGCGVAQGQVQVVLAWPDEKADLDLYVTDPNGQIARVDRMTKAGLTLAADCPKNEAKCSRQNVENAFLEGDEVASGKYSVRVRLESIPRELRSVRATIGVRSPNATIGYELEFFQEGQERIFEFEVVSSSDKE